MTADGANLPGSPRLAATRVSVIGSDVARIAAMVAIVYQHLLPIHDIPVFSRGVLNVGQVGVAVFCGLSGFFALAPSPHGSFAWLWKRVGRILPAYWLALTGVFAINAATGYKPTSLSVAVLEYAGLAALVPWDERVGQPYWFITLILACYAVGLLVRKWRWSILLVMVSTIALLPYATWFPIHVMSFVLGGALTLWNSRLVKAGIAIVLTALALRDVVFVYPAVAVMVLVIAAQFEQRSPVGLASAGRRTYEFFLVHGAVYLGMAKIGHLNFWQNAVAGSLIGCLAAWSLGRVTSRFTAAAHSAFPSGG